MLKSPISPREEQKMEIGCLARPEVDAKSTTDCSSKKSLDNNWSPSETASSTTLKTGTNNKNLEEIYAWVDQFPFSRPRKNIARDFSDAGITDAP